MCAIKPKHSTKVLFHVYTSWNVSVDVFMQKVMTKALETEIELNKDGTLRWHVSLPRLHRPNSMWTVRVVENGMRYFITDMAFEDVARAAANGIRKAKPDADVKVFYAKPVTPS